MVVGVAIQELPFAIDRLYDYAVPAELQRDTLIGMRVSVPFARGNGRREGMVLSVSESSSYPQIKSIDAWLDAEPVLSDREVQLVKWVKLRFFCTYYEAIRAMLPAGLWLAGAVVCTLTRPHEREENEAAAREDPEALRLLRLLHENGGSMNWSGVLSALGSSASHGANRLEELGLVTRVIERKQRSRDKTTAIAVLAISTEEAVREAERKRKRAPQQAELLRLLSGMGECSVKELRYFTGASQASINALERSGAITLKRREEFRRPAIPNGKRPDMSLLSEEQNQAYKKLRPLLERGTAAAALLYGVTGSGKTAIYIRLIRDTLENGKQALVLVPEIALTPQLMSVFYQHFGARTAVLHSALTVTQRYDEWKRIRTGQADVVVGTRSAVFAPLGCLGLLILDEEHETSYKSENEPRYHARDVAKYRCVQSGALLLLGSATPSVESMYEAKQGKYLLVELRNRHNAKALPKVDIVDMKAELREGNGGIISRALFGEIQKNLQSGEQTILFLNRRGASSSVSCPVCGFVYGCPRCSTKLTYHGANRRFMCHYCGYSQPSADRCPHCGGILNYFGLGTQKVEEELQKNLPGVGVLRMDNDTVSASNSHEAILKEFETKKVPILIGTQMVTKGLNFDNVTLVGVISADQLLYSPDFRARERSFSLITQVVGRAGRGQKAGRAVIQSYTPENEVIQSAAKQNYDGFYESEIEARKLLLAPPMRELYTISVVGTNEEAVLHCITLLKISLEKALTGKKGTRLLGPAPAGIVRINNRFRYKLTLSTENEREVRALTAAALRSFGNDKRFRDLTVFADVNPQDY